MGKFSTPIRHLKLLLKSITIHPGSAILLSSFCSTQFSTEQSTAETRLTYSTELVFTYAFICTLDNTCDITGPYTTVTNSLNPKTKASGSICFITGRFVSIGLPPYFLHSLAPAMVLSSPVRLLLVAGDIESFDMRWFQTAH